MASGSRWNTSWSIRTYVTCTRGFEFSAIAPPWSDWGCMGLATSVTTEYFRDFQVAGVVWGYLAAVWREYGPCAAEAAPVWLTLANVGNTEPEKKVEAPGDSPCPHTDACDIKLCSIALGWLRRAKTLREQKSEDFWGHFPMPGPNVFSTLKFLMVCAFGLG